MSRLKVNSIKKKQNFKVLIKIPWTKELFISKNEEFKTKFDFAREDIEIRLESLKTELEDKAEELSEQLNQMESQVLESKMSEDLIKKNIEDLQLKIDERFKIIFESFNGKLWNVY